LQIGFVDGVKATIVMNEKTAAVCFPSLDGRMHFTQGFGGKTPSFTGGVVTCTASTGRSRRRTDEVHELDHQSGGYASLLNSEESC